MNTISQDVSERTRVQSLDYLRGLMALAVMTYHYTGWSVGPLGSETVLGRLGIYAVSLFYILSGVSLAIVYQGRIRSGGDILDFAVKRVFRIFPLFYLVVTSALLLGWLSSAMKGASYIFPVYTAILNYSLTFGFIDPSAYLSTGAWSIGNEIVFYAVLPWLLLISNKSRSFLVAALLASVAIEISFAFFFLSPDVPIESQWNTYINPLNQIFLFLAGVAIGAYGRPRNGPGRATGLLLLVLSCVAVFCWWPSQGNQAHLVTGITRLVMSGACIVLVAAVFTWNPSSESRWVKPLAFLGEGCYSIYLLHPIVAIPIAFVFERLHPGSLGAAYTTAFVATLALSWGSFRFIEKPMIRAGRHASSRLRQSWRAAM